MIYFHSNFVSKQLIEADKSRERSRSIILSSLYFSRGRGEIVQPEGNGVKSMNNEEPNARSPNFISFSIETSNPFTQSALFVATPLQNKLRFTKFQIKRINTHNFHSSRSLNLLRKPFLRSTPLSVYFFKISQLPKWSRMVFLSSNGSFLRMLVLETDLATCRDYLSKI